MSRISHSCSQNPKGFCNPKGNHRNTRNQFENQAWSRVRSNQTHEVTTGSSQNRTAQETINIDHLKKLKIHSHLDEIIAAIDTETVIHVHAGTGSGKTVGIPLGYLFKNHDTGRRLFGSIPTIIAANAHYDYAVKMNPHMANKYSFGAGGEYSKNFGNAIVNYGTTQTIFNYLINKYKKNPEELNNIDIMIDESHHLSAENYLLMAITNFLLTKTNMRVIIASATPTPYEFEHLGEKPTNVFNVDTTQHPITINWARRDYIQKRVYSGDDYSFDVNQLFPGDFGKGLILETIDSIIKANKTGNILVFVPGEDHADKLVERAQTMYAGFNCIACYSNMDRDDMRMLSRPSNDRRIIFSTNFAESSVTIFGVTHVIDSMLHTTGFVKEGKEDDIIIETRPISRSSALQRKGRTGRTGPGEYYPLCTEQMFEKLKHSEDNQFKTMGKTRHVLKILSYGLDSQIVLNIPKEEYEDLLIIMKKKGLVDENNNITDIGKKIDTIPLNINLSIAFLESKKYLDSNDNAGYEENLYLMLLCACIETYSANNNIVMIPKDKRKNPHEKNDHIKDTLRNYDDCHTNICVLMKIFCDSMSDPDTKLYKWCNENSINYKMIKDIQRHFFDIYHKYYDDKFDYSRFSDLNSLIDNQYYEKFAEFFGKIYPIGITYGSNCSVNGSRLLFDNKIPSRLHSCSYNQKVAVLSTVTFNNKQTGRVSTIVTIAMPIIC